MLDSFAVEVLELRLFSSNFMRLALAVFDLQLHWRDYCPRVPSTILLSLNNATCSDQEPKILFDAEPAGSTRFLPLRLLQRQKWAKNFLAGFRPDIKKT